MVPPKHFCPSIHSPHSDVPSLQIVMQPIGKPLPKSTRFTTDYGTKTEVSHGESKDWKVLPN